MNRITDEQVPCVLCGYSFPVGIMTMNVDELWECDDIDACADRAGHRPPGTSAGLAQGPRRRTPPAAANAGFDALVAGYTQTCMACPAQWEGRLVDGRFFYFRYRSGHAALRIGDTREEAIEDSWGTSLQIGDQLDGSMDEDEFKHRLVQLWNLRDGNRTGGEQAGPSDEQLRGYLDRNPDAFAHFLHREIRRDPRWFDRYVRQRERERGRPFGGW